MIFLDILGAAFLAGLLYVGYQTVKKIIQKGTRDE